MNYLFLSLFGGILSTYYAEVVSGSMVNPLSNLFGILVTTPLYILHFSLFSFMALKYKKTSWQALYILGMLFGLYEAYITKVVWVPTWDRILDVGGIALFETVLLVCFWHPIMAFIVPFKITEIIWVAEADSEDILKLFLIHVYMAFFAAGNGHSTEAMLSGSFVVTLILITISFLCFINWQAFDINARPKGLDKTIIIGLIVLYMASFFVIRYDQLPNLYAQIPIWVLYILFIYLFIRVPTNEIRVIEKVSRTNLMKYVIILLFNIGLYVLLKRYFGHLEWLFILNYILAIGLGFVFFILTLFNVFSHKKKDNKA